MLMFAFAETSENEGAIKKKKEENWQFPEVDDKPGASAGDYLCCILCIQIQILTWELHGAQP